MKVLLGVCGGVAAYKAAELTRELMRRGAEVQVVLTAGAERFVTPLLFASLSGRQVLGSLWEPVVAERAAQEPAGFDIEHIQIAQWCDAVVIAPATANVLAKLAHGLTDDLLTTICLATRAPLLLAPAMNVNMWEHPATEANLQALETRGSRVVAPDAGYLACGMVGAGRLAEVGAIADAAMALLQPLRDLAGEVVLVTAGGTREAIDPVRFLGNRSSGRMGFALAEAARARGATVLLVTATDAPAGCADEVVRVASAAEMQAAVMASLPRASVVIMAAAVSDYRVAEPAAQKIKKRDRMTLELVRNEDILCGVVAARRPGTLVVGFAAETERVLEEGRRKLREKGVDLLVANDVSGAESGFEVDRNAGTLITRDTEVDVPPGTKRAMAEQVMDAVARFRLRQKDGHRAEPLTSTPCRIGQGFA